MTSKWGFVRSADCLPYTVFWRGVADGWLLYLSFFEFQIDLLWLSIQFVEGGCWWKIDYISVSGSLKFIYSGFHLQFVDGGLQMIGYWEYLPYLSFCELKIYLLWFFIYSLCGGLLMIGYYIWVSWSFKFIHFDFSFSVCRGGVADDWAADGLLPPCLASPAQHGELPALEGGRPNYSGASTISGKFSSVLFCFIFVFC